MATMMGEAKAEYWVDSGQWHGLQSGDPISTRVQLYLFNNADREVMFLLAKPKDAPSSSFTQEDVNAFVAGLSED